MDLIRVPEQPGGLCDAIYSTVDDAGVFAHELGVSISDWLTRGSPTPSACRRLVLQDRAGHKGDEPDDDASSWLRSWSESGWARFDERCRAANQRASELGIGLMIRPGLGGMLSDAVCTLSWCTRGAGQDATLLLDPLGWVAPSMMRDLDDHLDRICELCLRLIAHGRVGAVLVRSFDEQHRPVGLGEGAPDVSRLIGGLAPLIERAPNLIAMSGADLRLLTRTRA